ncbi:hypothetical protein CDAR_184562 [Caerostris darwini]|uniref:Uncharacterized protein n=1 Tax=Caerostris darwini TaxID=1538125 RepID=A0AAV4RHJ3_9ARAC|nr:hypothetical protein CDAR_184562 [Caerostris darwini]
MGIRDPATAKIGEEILPFEIETVPEYFRKKAEVELLDKRLEITFRDSPKIVIGVRRLLFGSQGLLFLTLSPIQITRGHCEVRICLYVCSGQESISSAQEASDRRFV